MSTLSGMKKIYSRSVATSCTIRSTGQSIRKDRGDSAEMNMQDSFDTTTTTHRGKLPDPAPKWQQRWEEMKLFRAPDKPDPDKKYFVMPMFAYPSGNIHMGHFRNYTMTDAIARKRMMEGHQVLHPFGWDAFGLPAEQAAINRGMHPEEWTLKNVAQSRATLQRIGISFDWSREVNSCMPDYYKWTQWMFVQLYKHGLAYRKASNVNWCPTCNTVLANEQAAGGVCWRCESAVETKNLTQWYFKITEYADRLQDDLDELTGWPDNLRALQRNWIGRSYGAEIDFTLENGSKFPIFTTRPDTIFGVTFMCIAPDSPLLPELPVPDDRRAAVEAFAKEARARQQQEDHVPSEDKSGFDTGVRVTNPLTDELIPLWVADYVLSGYGTGCIMAVPAHDQRDFEFARKYSLPIRPVIQEGDEELDPNTMTEAKSSWGTMVNSGQFNGLEGQAGFDAVIDYVCREGIGRAQKQYHLTDWLISRQRYWGAPIPMIECEQCGYVPVPEKDLPVLLPKGDIDFLPKGRSPLADVPEFMNVKCPKCDGDAQRDPDTMDTFMCSSWYFLRYVDPKNKKAPFDKEKAAAWLPIDYYMGGITHATGHLIYFRFFTKFLKDIGWLTVNEPATRMFNHGMVLDSQGFVMSKSRGNVISPIDMMEQHGVDPVRVAMFFATPGDREVLWSEAGMVGAERFLLKLDQFVRSTKESLGKEKLDPDAQFSVDDLNTTDRTVYRKLHQTIAKVDRDFDNMQLNTHIAAVMELLNEAAPGDQLGVPLRGVCAATMVKLMAPLTPHLAEEWWEHLGFGPSVFKSTWPQVNESALPSDTQTIAVQVNGKLRGQVALPADASEDDIVA
ncbi:MAG: leucine--tRNA ligase, partial [candidate division Zixibacteria bacterium]|nr:leucine--tRNA ligase [candidate division Zixibacteria bacterium]